MANETRGQQAISEAQQAYMDANWTDYDALVDQVSYVCQITVDAAYLLVEEGPVVYFTGGTVR